MDKEIKQIKQMIFALLIICLLLAGAMLRQDARIEKVQASTMAAWFELDQFRARLQEFDAKTKPEAIQRSIFDLISKGEENEKP
jgi:hypothetical protein